MDTIKSVMLGIVKREILFRGKRKERDFYGLGGEWIYGIPIQTHIGTFICFEKNPHYCNQYGYMEIEEISKVFPETVGQYTGLIDKNDTKIFEGDIVAYNKEYSGATKGTVYWCDGAFWVEDDQDKEGYGLLGVLVNYRLEVIGNIHDTPTTSIKKAMIKFATGE